jgi:hypothetical protein
MALIERYHVVAAERVVSSGETIKEGQIVSLNSSGEVVLQGSTNAIPYGIAGDTKSTSASAMPGVTGDWQSRVSDYFDETKASSKMTVYHSGGEFATDQFASNVSSASINAALYAVNGQLDTVDTQSSGIVARLIQAAGTYPSGVPGVDLNGDQALAGENSNTYAEVKLVI